MPRSGAVLVSDLPECELRAIEIACATCERRGRYGVLRLTARYGDISLPDLKAILPADCPRAAHVSPYERCKAYYASLPKI
jgi:hypothetical protein